MARSGCFDRIARFICAPAFSRRLPYGRIDPEKDYGSSAIRLGRQCCTISSHYHYRDLVSARRAERDLHCSFDVKSRSLYRDLCVQILRVAMLVSHIFSGFLYHTVGVAALVALARSLSALYQVF